MDLWGVGVGSWCVVSGGLEGGLAAWVGGFGGIGVWLWYGCGRGLVTTGVGSDNGGWWFGWWWRRVLVEKRVTIGVLLVRVTNWGFVIGCV